MIARRLCYAFACVLLLSACDDLPDWMGGEKEKPPLPGKRIAVLSDTSHVRPDETLADIPVTVPETKDNKNWREAGGGPSGLTGNLALTLTGHEDSASIGDGNSWAETLYTSPVVAEGMVFAMDAKGYISAHDAGRIDKILWTAKSLVDEGEPDIQGGGLAYEDGRLYATSGRGKAAALDAKTGKEIWKQALGVPINAAPKVGSGKVFVLSVDNQIFALDAEKGAQLWSHRGINENAGFLAQISPTVTDAIVLAPYSSGEIHALDLSSGQDIWNDTLLLAKRTTATAGFSGIGGNPIVKDDVVYAAGSSGFFAALSLPDGRRVWEQDLSSLNTPWIGDDFLYVLTNEDQLVCMQRLDGRVKWVKDLPRYKDEKNRRKPYVWRGPVMAGGRLLMAGFHGEMLALSPKDGAVLETIAIPENVTDAPVVAGGRLYFLTQNAKLHVLY